MPRLLILVPALLAGALFTRAETVRVTGTVREGEAFAKPVGRGLQPSPGAQILPKNRNFQFVLHERDYDGIMAMLRIHHDAGETLERVTQLGKGIGEIRVQSAKTAPGTVKESPRLASLRFSAASTFPGNRTANGR